MPEKHTFSSLETLRQQSHNDPRHDSEETQVDDTLDPRNWERWRKASLFLALMSSSFLADGYDNDPKVDTTLTTIGA